MRAWIAELGTGVGVIAIGIALLALPRDTPILGRPPAWVGISTLALGILLCLLSTATYARSRNSIRHAAPSPSAPVTNAPISPPAPPQREFVNQTPAELVGLYHNMTDLQAQKLLEPFIGRWIKVSGPFQNVRAASSNGIAWVDLSNNAGLRPGQATHLGFDADKWLARLSTLKLGEQLEIAGQIEAVDRHVVYLRHCELID
jgi:hypothetical protein